MNELVLKRELVKGTKANGVAYEFYIYYVLVNGIKVRLNPSDNTCKEVLNSYYDSNEE